MSKPVMSPSEFVGACAEVASRSKRSIEDVAVALEGKVDVQTPEKPVTASERAARLNHAAALARHLGIGVTDAEALVAVAKENA